MATDLKRLTFAVTPEMEKEIDDVRRSMYTANQSEIIRYILAIGLRAWRENKNSPVVDATGERH